MEACAIGTNNCQFVVKVIVLNNNEAPPEDGSITGMNTKRTGFAREAVLASEMGELVQNFLKGNFVLTVFFRRKKTGGRSTCVRLLHLSRRSHC